MTFPQVRTLVVRNLNPMMSEVELETIFSQMSEGQVERVEKGDESALIHFMSRQGAVKALRFAEKVNPFHKYRGMLKFELVRISDSR